MHAHVLLFLVTGSPCSAGCSFPIILLICVVHLPCWVDWSHYHFVCINQYDNGNEEADLNLRVQLWH